jgi:hypothetical protein
VNCPACQQPIDLEVTRAGLGIHPACNAIDRDPDILASELFSIVEKAIIGQPRSQQKRIGPSELGVPCDRRLGYHLGGVQKSRAEEAAWKPYVGTAIHAVLGDVMAAAEIASTTDGNTPRWHVEERVYVGDVNGIRITGSCDLFDGHYGTVYDWKTTTFNQIRERYRPHGPGEQYRRQAHLYGRGWQNAGHDVKTVAITFLVREGNFDQRHVWSEPYDEQVAIDTLERASSIALSIEHLGPDFTIPTLDIAESHCRFCPWFDARSADVSRSCPGYPQEIAVTPSLTQLIGA